MDYNTYNTQRDKLILPEYGRYIHQMVREAKMIPDRETRTRQVKAIINAMSVLNPQLRDMNDYYHKLWDHVYIIADYDLDVDAPFPPPARENFVSRPHAIGAERDSVKVMHYGRNIQNMVMAIASKPAGEERDAMTMALASYMRKQYLIWNKDTVSDHTIFHDIRTLSNGTLTVPEGAKLSEIQGEFRQPNAPGTRMQQRQGGQWHKNKKKKRSTSNGQ
ncbi:MAG: DUF4290 domain-containing protein [Bacteroidales bacterium]|jgi:hypothetical protein|nr:DUF4290 domain-containing protein [Bacteroidales bacterium]MDD2263945.1 DUF4290 domain-containing protein [Bacteroidales bacterium]MDD2831179.1 DUF4290 domain-containing protein [Bacteroidales bacterium]MDD3209290.1 DUF4290 domain-containing protein [Bacteroidales bacterium]MDD3697583.1 DUF4290 domain-containing protein [Bacteroidales bacterium]